LNQLFRFVVAGVINTLFYYLLYSFFIFVGLDYRLSVLFATLFGVFFSFKTFSKYVFESKNKGAIYRFIAVYIVLYLTNISLISMLELVIKNYYLSGLIATLICAGLSFVLNKKFVFKG